MYKENEVNKALNPLGKDIKLPSKISIIIKTIPIIIHTLGNNKNNNKLLII